MHINDIKDPDNFEYEGITFDGNVEFYITICEDSFVGDFFNKNIQPMEKAYIESLNFESNILEVVIKDAQEYILNK